MTTKKGFSPILIIVPIAFILGIAATFLYFQLKSKPTAQSQTAQIVQSPAPKTATSPSPQQSPDETANWKVFNNKYFGFTHKYPNDWKNDNGDQGPAQPVRENSEERYFHPSDAEYPKGITYMILPKNDKGIEVSKEKVLTWSFKNRKVEDITVDGYQGIKVSGLLDGVESEVAVLQNKGYVFEISSHEGFVDILDLMISTFKFTNQ